MTMGASEPLGTQVDSRVRLTYYLGHMQTQGLDSFKGFPTTMSQACLLFPWLSTCFSHWVTFLPLNITQLCFQIDTPVVILNVWPALACNPTQPCSRASVASAWLLVSLKPGAHEEMGRVIYLYLQLSPGCLVLGYCGRNFP